MVLAGGPDRERAVSLESGAAVGAALAEAGHEVRQRDIAPGDPRPLEEFRAWPGDLLFPALHGPWGEGGGLQAMLAERAVPALAPEPTAAERCMDKARTKACLQEAGLPTPPFELGPPDGNWTLGPPLAVKPRAEGSSIDIRLCRDERAWRDARRALAHHRELLVERLVEGREITVGVLAEEAGELEALPPLEIVPQAGFYDYAAKYERDDTAYRFEIPLPAETLAAIRETARAAHAALDAGPLSRIDLIVDADHTPWILEANTMPGFTSHSLLPKAAARAGLALPALVDRLVRGPGVSP